MARKGCGCGCFGCLMRLVIAVGLIVAVCAFPFVEAHRLTVDTHVVTSAQFPNAFDGLRIVFVSDIHKGPWMKGDRVARLIQQVNELNADLVLFGGDYADSSEEAIRFFETMPSVTARIGVAGVPGNNDRTLPESNLQRLTQAMLNAGVQPLVNRAVRISRGEQAIALLGVDDFHNGHPDVATLAAQMRVDDYVILLTHSPDLLPDALATVDSQGKQGWLDLALCGHTHGGQVTVMGYPLISRSAYGTKYLSGWKKEAGADILISNGVGVSYVPLRFGAPPQIHVITLKRQ